MNDLKTQLRTYLDETPEITLDEILEERLGTGDVRPLRPRTPAHRTRRELRRPAWVAAVAAFAGVLVLGGVAWLLGGGGDSAPFTVQRPEDTTSTTASPTTTAAAAATVVPTEWKPILTDTRALQAPPAATCPPGSDPDRSGSPDQDRPDSIPHAGLTAAFDRHAGRIVYVDAAGTTWTLDVCTNSWQEMDPTGTPFASEGDLFSSDGDPSGIIGDLVYDVDSDRTVMFSGDTVYVYDATANTWTADPTRYDTVRDPYSRYPLGAVYDPVSGLIVTTTLAADDRWAVWAYDVDTSTWMSVGGVAIDRTTPCCTQIDLLGYSPALDRLILTTYGEDRSESRYVPELEELTLLLDPRTGTIELLTTPSPIVDLAWLGYSYGQAGGTVFVHGWDPDSSDVREWGRICGFDTGTLEWGLCFEAPPGPQARDYAGYAAMVDDPINHRVVLINGRYGDWWRQTDAAVWAIDLRSGETLTLIAPAGGAMSPSE